MTEEKTSFPARGKRFMFHVERLGTAYDVRLPTDDEWFAYRRRIKDLTRDTDINFESAKLCRLLCETASKDNDEAALLLTKLIDFDFTEVEYADRKLTASCMSLPGRATVLEFSIPTLRQEQDMRRLLNESGGGFSNAAACKIFDDLLIEAIGYEDDVPAWHKCIGLLAVLMGLGKVNEADSIELNANFTANGAGKGTESGGGPKK